jgi:hypothetical protein
MGRSNLLRDPAFSSSQLSTQKVLLRLWFLFWMGSRARALIGHALFDLSGTGPGYSFPASRQPSVMILFRQYHRQPRVDLPRKFIRFARDDRASIQPFFAARLFPAFQRSANTDGELSAIPID